MKKTSRPRNVNAYIASFPRPVQSQLRKLRAAIRSAVPKAVERISYGMPYYAWRGRVAYFAAYKRHIGFYVPTPVIAEHKKELKSYPTNKATVRFPLGKAIPLRLVKKLVKARVKLNQALDSTR
jgi:uncharacterized protein YdhG (YjbR/CyaY superfamily)